MFFNGIIRLQKADGRSPSPSMVTPTVSPPTGGTAVRDSFLKCRVPSASARSRASTCGSPPAQQRSLQRLSQMALLQARGLGGLPVYAANAAEATHGCPDPGRPDGPDDPRPSPAALPPP